jgi:hypothetical protein
MIQTLKGLRPARRNAPVFTLRVSSSILHEAPSLHEPALSSSFLVFKFQI